MFGYGDAFAQELQRIGQISPDQFAAMFPAEANYLPSLSWDPTSAEYWDQFNAHPQTQLSTQELAFFKKNGFVVSWHLLNTSGRFESWRDMEQIIQTFVGSTDSMTFGQLGGLLAGAGIHSLADVRDLATLENLQADMVRGELGVQNIRSDWFAQPLGGEDPLRNHNSGSCAMLTLSMAADAFTVRMSKLLIGRDYILQRSSDLTSWQDAYAFTASAGTKEWVAPPSNMPRAFVRLKWKR